MLAAAAAEEKAQEAQEVTVEEELELVVMEAGLLGRIILEAEEAVQLPLLVDRLAEVTEAQALLYYGTQQPMFLVFQLQEH